MIDRFHCRCYGLGLVSNVPIPGLAPETEPGAPTLRIDLGLAPDWPDPSGRPANTTTEPARFELADGRAILKYPDGTCFHIDFRQSRIWATWPEPLTLEDTATYLLGPVLGHYLRRLGRLCLHASCAVIDGRCVAFVGAAGSGKSTLAAALALQGAGILSEDVTCLADEAEGFCVQQGYPRIRLWSESAALIGKEPRSLPLLTPNWDKRFLPLNGKGCVFHGRAERLHAIFLLAPRRAMAAPAEIERPGGQRMLSELVANTYGTLLLDERQRLEEFGALGRLVSTVPVRVLTLNSDGSRLFAACDWIRHHALA